jgi:very-short-patch-repair endonuclease
MSCRSTTTIKVDFLWEEQRLAVQVDGPDRPPRNSDERLADLALEAQGYRVLRLTEREVFEEPERIADLLARELKAAESRGAN